MSGRWCRSGNRRPWRARARARAAGTAPGPAAAAHRAGPRAAPARTGYFMRSSSDGAVPGIEPRPRATPGLPIASGWRRLMATGWRPGRPAGPPAPRRRFLRRSRTPEGREERGEREGELACARWAGSSTAPSRSGSSRGTARSRWPSCGVERCRRLRRDGAHRGHELLVGRGVRELREVGERGVLVGAVGGDRPALVVLAEHVLVVVGVVAARERDVLPS